MEAMSVFVVIAVCLSLASSAGTFILVLSLNRVLKEYKDLCDRHIDLCIKLSSWVTEENEDEQRRSDA